MVNMATLGALFIEKRLKIAIKNLIRKDFEDSSMPIVVETW